MASFGSISSTMSWIFLEWRRVLQKDLLPYNITKQQLSVLSTLIKKGEMSPNEIADWLHCDRPTATVVIKNLERRDFLSRKKNPNNKKFQIISISEKGLEFFEFVNKDKKTIEENPFDVLSQGELEQLDAMLKKVKERVSQIKEERKFSL